MRILFICWDGPQLTYLESLFLPIFERLGQHGYQFDILQFSWGDKPGEERVRAACARAGIGFRRVETWRRPRPLGPFLTAFAGGRQIERAVRAFGSELLMPRSIMAGLATLRARRRVRLPILYDADGLAADERVDFAGLSPTSATYRLMRAIETRITRAASAVITRSDFASAVLAERAGPSVSADRFRRVANGRDPVQFNPHGADQRAAARAELGIAGDAPLIVYAGSVGGQYETRRIAILMRAVRQLRPDARLLVLSGDPDSAKALVLDAAPEIAPASRFMSATPTEVPRLLAAADLGIAFRTPSFSMRAVSPIKTAEYLLCGVPVLGTAAIGDTQAAREAGVFFDESLGEAAAALWLIEQILPKRDDFRQRARQIGVDHFSLDRSVADYRAALELVVRDADKP